MDFVSCELTGPVLLYAVMHAHCGTINHVFLWHPTRLPTMNPTQNCLGNVLNVMDLLEITVTIHLKSPPRMHMIFYQPYLATTLYLINLRCLTHPYGPHSDTVVQEPPRETTGRSSHRYSSLPHKKRGNLRVCVINCNSARNRQAQFEKLAKYVKPDVMLITETKLTDDIKSSEFLPDAYSGTIRRDWNDKGGGVMIAIHRDLDVVDIELCENTAETVWAKLLVKGEKPILLGCFYQTNSTHTPAQI